MYKKSYKTHEQNHKNFIIVGVRFRNNGTIYDFRSNLSLKVGDVCIVESKNVEEFGIISSTKRKLIKGHSRRQFSNVIRKATRADIDQVKKNILLEKEAGKKCSEIIKTKNLKMNLISTKFSFNAQKAHFYLKGEGRLDFKGLVKELADYFNIKIEVKQVGLRDSARLLGGCGLCGKTLCCASFLKGFQPVSIKMAKEQNLALSPMKISGVCGRLLCCLVFEHKTYRELNKKLPKCGVCINSPKGIGKVIQRNILQEEVVVKLDEEGTKVKVKATDIKIIKQK